MSNKVRITVGGVNYSVSGDESEKYMQELGLEVERKLKHYTNRNQYLSTTMAAIMTAFEFCDEAKKLREENKKLNQKIERLQSSDEDKLKNAITKGKSKEVI